MDEELLKFGSLLLSVLLGSVFLRWLARRIRRRSSHPPSYLDGIIPMLVIVPPGKRRWIGLALLLAVGI
jgi:hypothetical protein